jgi:hypothetical protein
MTHRSVFGRGVILGNPHQRSGQCQADQRGQIQIHGRYQLAVNHHAFAQDPGGHGIESDHRQHAGDDQPLVQRVHDLGARLGLDKEGADNGSDNGNAAQHQRIDHRLGGTGNHQTAQHHGGDNRHGVGFEQVGCHAGAVTHVVTHVVGDHGRVARIIFGDAGFDLAYQVGTDVSALGEDTAAKTGEDGDQRATKSQAHQSVSSLLGGFAHHQRQECVVTRHAQQP